MKFKKQIGIIISCIAILAVVFFAVSYVGGKEKTASNKDDSNAVETGAITNDNTNNEETADNSSEDDKDTANKTEDEKDTATNDKDTEVAEGIKEGYYTVKETDTLFSIAKTYMPNSDPTKVVEAIKERNKLSNDVIAKGQKIIISYETALENQSSSSKGNTVSGDHSSHKSYVVKEGDTLFSIAQQYMTSMNVMDGIEAIKADNNMGESTVIKVDQTICIPASQQ